MLEQLWRNYVPCLALRAKLSVQVLEIQENMKGFTWEELKQMQRELVLQVFNLEYKEIATEEKMYPNQLQAE